MPPRDPERKMVDAMNAARGSASQRLRPFGVAAECEHQRGWERASPSIPRSGCGLRRLYIQPPNRGVLIQ